MIKIFLPIYIAALLAPGAAFANDSNDDWVVIAEGAESLWYGKKASGHFVNVAGGKNNGYAFVYQMERTQENKVKYGKIFVEIAQCKNGYGHIVSNSMKGEFESKSAFVRFGPTIADYLGSAACDAWDRETGKVSRVNDVKSWQQVAISDDNRTKYFIKFDTIRKKTNSKVPSIAGLLSEKELDADTIKYKEVLMGLSDCRNGYGTLYIMDVEGVFEGKLDVALNGKSIASSIAGALCRKI